MAESNWKKAQNKVADALKLREALTKDCWPKRFTDSHEAGNIVQNQPSDQWCLDKGVMHFIEVKSSEYHDKFYVKDVRPSQFIAARRAHAAGGRFHFIIVKLPDWQWYRVDGMTMWACKEAGEPGIRWADMEKIKLTAENILR